jgi:hypothetical protein
MIITFGGQEVTFGGQSVEFGPPEMPVASSETEETAEGGEPES